MQKIHADRTWRKQHWLPRTSLMEVMCEQGTIKGNELAFFKCYHTANAPNAVYLFCVSWISAGVVLVLMYSSTHTFCGSLVGNALSTCSWIMTVHRCLFILCTSTHILLTSITMRLKNKKINRCFLKHSYRIVNHQARISNSQLYSNLMVLLCSWKINATKWYLSKSFWSSRYGNLVRCNGSDEICINR